MSGFTTLRATFCLKCPVDSHVDRGLQLLTSGDPATLGEEESDLPNHEFWQSSPYFMLEGRLAYDGRNVVVDAEIKNKQHELEKFLLWLAPSIDRIVQGTWFNEDDLGAEPLVLLFAAESSNFVLRGLKGDMGLTNGGWRPT
jgi:hypothetical protein